MGEPTAYVTSGSQDRDGGGGVGDSDVPEEMEQETRSEPATNSLEMTLPYYMVQDLSILVDSPDATFDTLPELGRGLSGAIYEGLVHQASGQRTYRRCATAGLASL